MHNNKKTTLKPLFIYADYLPNKDGGTIRIEKNIKYIGKQGINGIVFTQKRKGLLKFEIIGKTKIYRSYPFNLSSIYILLISLFKKKAIGNKHETETPVLTKSKGRLADFVFVPDIYVLWALFGYFKLYDIIKKEKINVLYSSGGTHSTHLLPLLINLLNRKKIRWVTEFRDPWISNPFRDKKWFPFEQIDRWLEKKVILNCDHIIVTSEKYRTDFLKSYPMIDGDKISYIPNGFDSEDFNFLKNYKKIKNKIFTIVSTGNYYQKRSLLPFLEAMSLLKTKMQDFEEKIKFIQYGKLDLASQEYLKINPMKNIEILKFIPHQECLLEMFKADQLLLIPGPGDGTMPGKVFEYLASGTKIIGLIDEGPAKDLIQKVGGGEIFFTNDREAVANYLSSVIDSQLEYNNKSIQLWQYDRKNIAIQTVNVLLGLKELKHEKS